MRIVAGAWRGRALIAPSGQDTRPTSDRMRQSLFDMLLHAEWGGRHAIEGGRVADVFAGTGALGLEALSRGAVHARFVERDRAALAALRANIAALGAASRCEVLAMDTLAVPTGEPCDLVFLDPPYGQALIPRAVAKLREAGWITPGTLIVAEIARDEELELPMAEALAGRAQGAARVSIWRAQ